MQNATDERTLAAAPDHNACRTRCAFGCVGCSMRDAGKTFASMRGLDAVIVAVGFEAKGSATATVLANLKVEGSSAVALRQAIAAERCGGVISVPGVYAGFIHAVVLQNGHA